MTVISKRHARMFVVLSAVFTIIFSAAVAAAAGPGISNDFDGRRVLILGIDGAQRDALQTLINQNRAPNIASLANTGVSYWNMEAGGPLQTPSVQPTLTGPGWASILTGTFHNKNGRYDNDSDWYLDGRFHLYPHFYRHIRAIYPNAWLGSVGHATTPNNVLLRSGDGVANLVYTPTSAEKNSGVGDVRVTQRVVSVLQNQNPDALFVHFLTPDGAGHAHGYGKTIPQYMSTLETVDNHIGDILNALRNRPQYAAEKWLVIVTTDHGGGLNKAHGSQSDDDRHIFGIFNGLGFSGGIINNTKTFQSLFFPTVLNYLGIAVDPDWDTEDPPADSAAPYPTPVHGVFITDVQRSVKDPKSADNVTISAHITGADSVTLHLAINNSAFTPTPMTLTGSNRWEVTVPSHPEGTRVRYFFEGSNTDTTSRLPFPSAAIPYYSYTVEDKRTDATDLVINEIMYNPAGGDNSTRAEWVEIYNRRNAPINVSHYWAADTVASPEDFLIPEGTIIPPNGYLLLVWDYNLFISSYPALAADPTVVIVDIGGAYALNNDADSPSLIHVNDYQWNYLRSEPFQHVPYSATAPWPHNTSGGPSIELNHPTLDVANPANWSLSTASHGTPGKPNSSLESSGLAIMGVSRNLEFPSSADPILITATIKADDIYVAAYVHATVGTANRTVLMTRLNNHTLQANLGTVPNDTLIQYHIQAAAGTHMVTWPSNAPSSREIFRVNDHPAIPGDLVINEVDYDPQGTDNGTNSEWFEIVNTTPRALDVSHFYYSVRKDHVPAQFPEGTIIPANGYLVVAGIKTLFETRNPSFPNDAVLIDAGWPSGTSVMTNSNNSNLLVRLQHINSLPRNGWAPPPAIDEVPYRRTGWPWPGEASNLPNSNGHTIELLHPSLDNTDGSNWRVSTNLRGTPGAKNSVNTTPSSVRDWSVY